MLVLFVLGVWFSKTDLSIGRFSSILGVEHELNSERAGHCLFEKNNLADLIDREALLSNPGGKIGFTFSGECRI